MFDQVRTKPWSAILQRERPSPREARQGQERQRQREPRWTRQKEKDWHCGLTMVSLWLQSFGKPICPRKLPGSPGLA